MAALTENKQVPSKVGELASKPVVASDIIYLGALCKNNAAGYLAPCAAEAGATFAGVSVDYVDNSSGSAGDKVARVERKGLYLLEGSGFAQANVGASVYASDDQTVSLVQGANEQEIGKIVRYISATQVWVDIEGTAI